MEDNLPVLYHYEHCPFCVRIRLTCGFFKISYKSVVLPYDDEKTPLDLMGKKMLPIWQDNLITSNESLDIIKHIDSNQSLIKDDFNYQKIEPLLTKLGELIHPLAMPHWVYTYEFSESSRNYFLAKKEAKRGPFRDLFKQKRQFLQTLDKPLKELEKSLNPFYESKEFSIYDILLASHLWGLYIVPEFQFSPAMHNYLQGIKEKCQFDYQGDFWK